MRLTESWSKKVFSSWSEAFKKSEELPCSQLPCKPSTKKTSNFMAWEILQKSRSNKLEHHHPAILHLVSAHPMKIRSTSFQRALQTHTWRCPAEMRKCSFWSTFWRITLSKIKSLFSSTHALLLIFTPKYSILSSS